MSVLKIFTFPDKVLLKDAEPIKRFDSSLKNLVSDMFETMRAANGIGLAAPQVGHSKRLIVVEIPNENEEIEPDRLVVCNPKILTKSGHAKIEEGCLSLPEFFVEVDRAKNIVLAGQDMDGEPIELEATGLFSICIQHEIDHLNGTLLVSYVDQFEREAYRQEMKKRRSEKGKLKL